MIDNELLALFHNIEHKGENLDAVATVLNSALYKDIMDWYVKYTGKSRDDNWARCASLLYFLYVHDNIDFADAAQFDKFQGVLCEKYGVQKNDIFLFLADYRKLLNN